MRILCLGHRDQFLGLGSNEQSCQDVKPAHFKHSTVFEAMHTCEICRVLFAALESMV